MSESSIFTFRFWWRGSEFGLQIGWVWIAVLAAIVWWAFS